MPELYQQNRLFSPQGEYERKLLRIPPSAYEEPTGFLDNWKMSLNMSMYEEMSNSRERVMSKYKAERRVTLSNLIKEGKLSENVVGGFQTNRQGDRAIDWNLLAHYVKSKGIADVMTDDDIVERVTSYLDVMRVSQADMLRRANMAGYAGYFLGAMTADMLDPMLIPGFFVGYGGAARAATWVGRLGVAAKVGAVEGLLEAARQPFIARWKNETGIDYNAKDALTAILFTAGAAGGLTATAESLAHGLRKLAQKTDPRKRFQLFARRKIDAAIDEMVDTPPDNPTVRAVDHGARIEDEVIYQERRAIHDEWEDYEGTEAAIYHVGTDFKEKRFETSRLPRSRETNNFVEEDLPRLYEELATARARIKEIFKEAKDQDVASMSFDEVNELQQRATLLNDAINGVEARARIPLKNRIINAARTIANNEPNRRVRFSQIYDALGGDGKVDLDEFKQALKELQQEKKAVLMHLDDPRERFPADEKVAVDVTGMGHNRHIAYFSDYDQIPEPFVPEHPKTPRVVRNITQETPPNANRMTDEVVDAAFDDLVADETADVMVPTGEQIGDELRMENIKEAVERTNKQYEAANKFKECLVAGRPRTKRG